MKKIILVLIIINNILNTSGKTWTIVNSGFTFTPATLTINQGDDVNFEINSSHDAVEISQSAWNADETSPAIGFSVPFGGGNVSSSELIVGTHYYICVPHASVGMKGKIIVQPISGFEDITDPNGINIYPNPIRDFLNIQFTSLELSTLEIILYNLDGKTSKVLLEKTQVSGSFLKRFDLTNETQSGVYFIRIMIGQKSTYRKIVVL